MNKQGYYVTKETFVTSTTWEKKARELGMQKQGEEIFLFKDEEELKADK
ncbi:MAG: hypothetical protein KAU01_02260 [Candidatus Cloacimonetes bacterium]|nr:hypothetical protein [Candidatus Cloacimonadota bacterium]